jgi:hypothetical protein
VNSGRSVSCPVAASVFILESSCSVTVQLVSKIVVNEFRRVLGVSVCALELLVPF